MSTNNDKRVVEWLDLPKEVWPLVAKRLNTTIDLLHFRSTCTTWRSATPPPFPSSTHTLFPPIPHANFTLLQTKLYRLQHPSSSSSSSSSSSKAWIIMFGHSKSFPLGLLDPFTNSPLSHTYLYSHHTSPKVLNLLNFNFVELTESYSLNYETHDEDELELSHLRPFMRVPEVRKVVLFPSLTLPSDKSRMVFALYNDGKLRVSKIGDEGWTVLDDNNRNPCCCDDVILHMGQLYVVDKLGTISWVDCESLKVVQFSPMLCGFGKRKRLVECGGSLYVVDMHIEGDPDHPTGMYREVVDVKVYWLDEEWGRWLNVKDLGDVAFVLGKDSNFSLKAQDYYGCEGNCVYFYSAGRACAFSLKNSQINSSKLFWPCPSLFHPRFNS